MILAPLFTVAGGWYPRFSPDGQYLAFGFRRGTGFCAVADGIPHWVVPDGIPCGWYGLRRIMFQRETVGRAGVWTYDVVTGAQERLSTLQGSHHDATEGHWGLNQPTLGRLYWDGRLIQDRDCIGVKVRGTTLVTLRKTLPGGREVWVLDYWVNGVWVRGFDPPGPQNEWHLGDDGWLGYGYHGRARVAPLTSVTPATSAKDVSCTPNVPRSGEGVPRVFRWGGGLWVLTACEVGAEQFLALRPFGDREVIKVKTVVRRDGRDVEANVPGVRPSLHVESPETVLVASEGTDGTLRVFRVRADSSRETIGLPAVEVERFPRKVWLAYYKAQGRDGDHLHDALETTNSVVYGPLGDTATGTAWRTELRRTCQTLRAKGAYLFTEGHPDVIEAAKDDWDRVAGLIVTPQSGTVWTNVATVSAQAKTARETMAALGLPRREVIGYFDGPLGDWFRLPDVEALALQCYLGPAAVPNPVPTLRARIADQLRRLPQALPVYLVQQSYDRNGVWTDLDGLEAMQTTPAEFVDDARVNGLWYFAYARRGGVLTHPRLRPAHRAIFEANPGTPAVRTLPTPDPAPEPTPAPTPMPPPTEPVMKKIALRADSAQFVRAVEGGNDVGEVRADRDQPAAHETFLLHPLPGGKWALESHNGRFLSAQPDGTVQCNRALPTDTRAAAHLRTAIGEWEQFTRHVHPNGRVSYRAWTLKYLCAEGGGGREVVCNRDAPNAWEQFEEIVLDASAQPSPVPPAPAPTPTPPAPPVGPALEVQVVDDTGRAVPSATVAIQDGANAGKSGVTDARGRVMLDRLTVPQGQTVCAEAAGFEKTCVGVTMHGSGNVTITITRRTGSGGPSLPNVPGTPTRRQGIVHGNQFTFEDSLGMWLPWGTSLFWAAYGYLHERERVESHLQRIRQEGIDFIRVIATGLRRGPTERSVSPKDPRWQEAISGLTDLAWSYGLRVQWTIFGAVYDAPSAAERKAAVTSLCDALRGREEAVWAVEIANEGSSNGFPGTSGARELKDLAAVVAGRLPNLVSTTGLHGKDDIHKADVQLYYEDSKASLQMHHYSRSIKPPDGIWRPNKKPWREQLFQVERCAKLVQSNESRGPEASGSETNDPHVLAMDAAVTWLCGVGSYVLHCGAGIYGLFDPRGGGPSDDRPSDLWDTENFSAICAAIRTVQRLLPADLPNWQKHQVDSSRAPFKFDDVPEEQFTSGYSASKGGEIVQMPVGLVRTTEWTLRSGSCDGQVFHPVTGEVLQTFTRSYKVTPAMRAVIVRARKRP